MSKIIGIDFGTTKAIAAAMKDGSPVVIPDRRGRNSIPSLVLLTPETEKKSLSDGKRNNIVNAITLTT